MAARSRPVKIRSRAWAKKALVGEFVYWYRQLDADGPVTFFATLGIVGKESDERMTMVERGEGVAAWRQIANQLEADISFGRLGPGSRLPVETDLAARFSVNRHTVRRALAELSALGLIRAAQGRGTFVAGRPLAYPIGARTRFSEIVSGAGREAGGRLLGATETVADEPTAQALAIAAGAPVMRLETLRSADGIPI